MSHIKKISVEHFRALKSIEFEVEKMSILIGENDVGKTSVLYALRVFYLNKKLDDLHDYHQHNREMPVTITLTFQTGDEEIVVRRVFPFSKTPETYVLNGTTMDKMSSKDDVLKKINAEGFYFFPVNRDVAVQFAMGKTAMLGKLIRDCIREKLGEVDTQTALDLLKDKTKEAIEMPRHGLEKHLRRQMHNQSLKLLFDDVDVDLVDGVSLSIGLSDDRVKAVPLCNRGAGTQNNLVIALFRYLAERQTAGGLIIALEEPENSLHPKAQRQLLSVLMDLSIKHQVICTTHSPVFIERTNFESNVLITRKNDGTSEAKVFSSEVLRDVRSELGIRPSDALLKGGGNCALIVEGETEEEAMPDFFEMCGKSEFQLGVSIIKAGGCDYEKIRRICLLLKSFDIPAVVMLDADAKQHAENLKRGMNTELSNLKEVYLLKKGTIEDYFPKKVIREMLNGEGFNAIPPVLDQDLPEELSGLKLLSRIKQLMHERKCGNGIDHFKTRLGLRGVKIMQREGIAIDDELKAIIEKVASIAQEE